MRPETWPKGHFRGAQTYYLEMYQAIRGSSTAILASGHDTHQPNCPHIVRTLQTVVDQVGMPLWLPGRWHIPSPSTDPKRGA